MVGPMDKICHCEICGESFTLTEDQAQVAIVTKMDDGSEHEYKVCDACFGRVIEPLIGCCKPAQQPRH